MLDEKLSINGGYMNNKELTKKLNDEYIKGLTLLKLKKNHDYIKNEDYRDLLIDLTITYGFSDFSEMLSRIALNSINERIENMQNSNGVSILFNEKVEVLNKNNLCTKNCDLVLLGNDTIEVITIAPLEVDFRHSFDDEESMLLGIGIIDKFAAKFDCNNINLTVIQPNLMSVSVYGTSVNKFLHEYDYSLLWD